MMRMVGKRMLIGMLAAVAVATMMPAGDAFAGKGKKEKIKARINGKAFKANVGASIVGVYDTNLHLLTVSGLFQKIRPGRGQIKTLLISAAVDMSTMPASGGAVSQFSDNSYKGFVPGTPNAWAGEGLTVTITAFDGTRVTGTFEGTIPAGSGEATEPAVVKGGKFSVDLGA